ncbi:unnamed protein product [Owenia fusiformis]|uniref:Uncharacterized protein n=1 Tax=Owenia fusiformis TaxID=6347 RepID=A0A8J1U7D0_OWEFU|nr:unnamed protein product [Owenia fusiformis]
MSTLIGRIKDSFKKKGKDKPVVVKRDQNLNVTKVEKRYPGKIEANMHRAHCYIPAALAAVLEDNPQLLAAGVEAFYYRDPVDLKACRTFTHFRPGTRVMREVKFTRCLYAQLMQQRFQPDPRSGWTLPATSNPKHKSHELGMKLAHGFEILCAKCSAKPGQTNPSTIADNDVRWQRYKSTLQEKGYFKGEVEGSQLYRQLEQSAKKHFSEAVATQESNSKDAGHQVLTLLDSLKYDIEDLRKQEKNLKKPDNDSWLDITPQQLDDLIHKTTGQNTTDDTFDLTDIANSMKSFVNNVSGFEGAEFPGQEEGDIQFNSSSFMQDMQKLVDLDDNMGDSSSDDMSEYGSDDELDELGPSPRKPPPKQNGQSMKGYMDAMDRELAQTNVWKSFERESKPVAPPRHKKAKVPARARPESDEFDIDDLDDDFEPVNVDLTVVKNMMESYKSQQGLPGPGGNILGSMGVRIPEDSGSSDQDSTPAATPTSERESPKKETTV